MEVIKMETEEIKNFVKQAEEAVQDIKDETYKQIAFKTVLEMLLVSNQKIQISSVKNLKINQKDINTTANIPNNITEFFAEKNPNSDPDNTVTIAYYYHYTGDGDFNVENLLNDYEKLSIPKPGNPTDIINKNIRKRFITKVDKQKNSKQAYHITKLGIIYVNNNFSMIKNRNEQVVIKS